MLICYLKHWVLMALIFRILLCLMTLLPKTCAQHRITSTVAQSFTSNPFVLKRLERLLNDRIMPILIVK